MDKMSSIIGGEIRRSEIPIPLINYVNLLIKKVSPYYEVIQFLLKDMEFCYKNAQREGQSEIVYTINPRMLQEQIEKKIRDEKLTTINISRTILAFFYLTGLKEKGDFYTTTTHGGRKNYHVRLTSETINLLWKPLFV